VSGSQSFAGPEDLAYFKQFLFKKENVSDDPDFPSYQVRFLMSTWNDKIPMANGKYLNAHGNLYLYENGTFVFRYSENYFDTPDANQFTPGPCKKLSGHWSVPDKNLVLDGIGYGERAMVDNFHAVRFTYTQDLHSPGLKGHSVNFAYGFSNTEEIFCF
jgi:hypothetical protein